jgi:uncharacterized protein YeaO (DUF488 family)
MPTILLKRVYEPPSAGDGLRILVERLWPRGLTKRQARVDLWAKELAPSRELRIWFAHRPERWPEFRKRYTRELRDHAEAVQDLLGHLRAGDATFVYAAADTERNSAVVLERYLARKLGGRRRPARPRSGGQAPSSIDWPQRRPR